MNRRLAHSVLPRLLVSVAIAGAVCAFSAAPTGVPPSSRQTLVEDFRAFDSSRYFVAGNAYWDQKNEYFVLTKPQREQTGRLFFKTPVAMQDWIAEFEIRIGEGGGLRGGADGMTFAFVRRYDYPKRWGGALDFGSEGYAVEFDTYPYEHSGDLGGHHIALINDDVQSHPKKSHLKKVVVRRGLRDNAWHPVRIRFESGRLNVFLDGEEIFSHSIPNYAPFTGHFGFTASTGNGYEWHIVRNVRIDCTAPAKHRADESASRTPVKPTPRKKETSRTPEGRRPAPAQPTRLYDQPSPS